MTPRTTPRLRHTAGTLALALALIALATSCSSDDDTDANRRNEPVDTDGSTTATTQPPASDEGAAFPIIEDLVVEAVSITDDLLQHPEKVEDPDHEQVTRLREIHTDDSPTPDGVVAQAEELNRNHQHQRPAASGVFDDFGVYRMAAVDDDTVRFRTCASEDSETVDDSGEVVARVAQVTQGTGEARRVDGIWLVYGLHMDDDRTLPIRPGSANPGFCDDLYAEGGQ